MFSPLIRLAPPEPVLRDGDRIEGTAVVRASNKPLQLEWREREAWVFTAKKGDGETISVTLTRRLLETAMGDGITAAPPEAVRTDVFVVSSTGELRYRPFAKTPLEGRLFRILEALLPKDGGAAAGRAAVEFTPSEREKLPAAAFARTIRRRAEGLVGVSLSYREEGKRALGEASLDERSGWPLLMSFRIGGLTLPGGDEPVETEFSFAATKATLRGKAVGLPPTPVKEPG